MKLSEMNSKAKEAFANSQIEVGVSIFKSIMLLVTTVPLALFLKANIDGKTSEEPISILNIFQTFSTESQVLIGALFGTALFLGHNLRNAGLKILNEIESET